MIVIAGTVQVDPEALLDFVSDMNAVLPEARAADGNLSLLCAVEDAATGSVLLLERWRDQAAINAYMTRPEIGRLFQKWGPIMRSNVRKYDVTNERNPLE